MKTNGKTLMVFSQAIVAATCIAFHCSAQTPPGPTPYGHGTFLSYDPEYLEPVPFYCSPSYFYSSDSLYAVSGPDNIYNSVYQGDYFSYGVTSDLNMTPIYQLLLESSGTVDADSSLAQSSAIGNNGTIYIASSSGVLYAINPNGTTKWTYFGINQKGLGVFASPSIGLDGNIYIATDDAGEVFYCIDPDLGLPKWILRLTVDMDASPLCTTSGIYDVDEGGYLHFITYYGQEYTPLQIGPVQGSYGSSSPAITGQGYLCIGNGNGDLEIVDPEPMDLGGGGILQSVATDGSTISASPVIGPDGNVYVGTIEGDFFAIQLPANEKSDPPQVIAEASLGSSVFPTTAAVGSDAHVYVGTSSDVVGSQSSAGSFYSMHLQATSGQTYPYQFVVDWETNVAANSQGQGGGFISSPLLAQVGASHNQNVVYEPNVDGNIYAFQASSGPSTTTWSTFQGNAQRQGNWGSGAITPPQVWSVQFGPNPLVAKGGKAAYGNSPSDYWNVIDRYNSVPTFGYNLLNTAESEPTNASITFTSGAGFHGLAVPGSNPFHDPLMTNCVIGKGTFTFVIQAPTQGFKTGAPALYDIYIYAYGGQEAYNGTTYSVNAQISIDPAGTDPVTGGSVSTLTTSSTPPPTLSQFVEGYEYVVFRDVPMSASGVSVTISRDPNDPVSGQIVNGIQIVAKQ